MSYIFSCYTVVVGMLSKEVIFNTTSASPYSTVKSNGVILFV